MLTVVAMALVAGGCGAPVANGWVDGDPEAADPDRWLAPTSVAEAYTDGALDGDESSCWTNRQVEVMSEPEFAYADGATPEAAIARSVVDLATDPDDPQVGPLFEVEVVETGQRYGPAAREVVRDRDSMGIERRVFRTVEDGLVVAQFVLEEVDDGWVVTDATVRMSDLACEELERVMGDGS